MERTCGVRYVDTEKMHYRLGWLGFIGFGLMVVGMTALYSPYYAHFLLQYQICSFFLICGGMFVAHAFWSRGEGRFVPEVSIGISYLIFGILIGIFAEPQSDTLTLFLSIFFLVEGIQKIFFALRLRPEIDWTWGLTSGIFSLIISVLIWALPYGSPLVCVMVGLDLIESGLATIMIAHYMRKALEERGILCMGNACFSE